MKSAVILGLLAPFYAYSFDRDVYKGDPFLVASISPLIKLHVVSNLLSLCYSLNFILLRCMEIKCGYKSS